MGKYKQSHFTAVASLKQKYKAVLILSPQHSIKHLHKDDTHKIDAMMMIYYVDDLIMMTMMMLKGKTETWRSGGSKVARGRTWEH